MARLLPPPSQGNGSRAKRGVGWAAGDGSAEAGRGEKVKQKKCKVCRTEFTPSKPMQCVCGLQCALSLASSAKAKRERSQASQERNETKAKLEKLKSRADWAREAQAEVNRYVRYRDMHLGCVSCDKPATWDGQWHASHFRSVGAASAVRFNLWNIHKSCSVCNNWKSGNLSDYEPRLRAKIGDAKVDWLRTQNHVVSYSVDYLKRVKKVFAKKSKRSQ